MHCGTPLLSSVMPLCPQDESWLCIIYVTAAYVMRLMCVGGALLNKETVEQRLHVWLSRDGCKLHKFLHWSFVSAVVLVKQVRLQTAVWYSYCCCVLLCTIQANQHELVCWKALYVVLCCGECLILVMFCMVSMYRHTNC